MRSQHQEAHVIGDLLGGEQGAVLLGRAAQLGEQVRRLAMPPFRDLAGEEVDDHLAPFHAPPHRRAGDRRAHEADRGREHVDEGAIDGVRLGTQLDAEKRGGGEIEGELLDGGVELQIGGATLPVACQMPFGDAAGDAVVERAEVGLHRGGLEGDAERLAVQAMLVEVHQHQPARENLVEDQFPSRRRRRNSSHGRTEPARWPRGRAGRRCETRTRGCGTPGRTWHAWLRRRRRGPAARSTCCRRSASRRRRGCAPAGSPCGTTSLFLAASDRLQAWSWSAPLAQSLPATAYTSSAPNARAE